MLNISDLTNKLKDKYISIVDTPIEHPPVRSEPIKIIKDQNPLDVDIIQASEVKNTGRAYRYYVFFKKRTSRTWEKAKEVLYAKSNKEASNWNIFMNLKYPSLTFSIVKV
jgi:hypothetical protein